MERPAVLGRRVLTTSPTTFQARLCNRYALPCSFTNHSDCVTIEQAEQVFRAGDWEWQFYWHRNPQVIQYIQAVEGLFIGEIVGRPQAVLDGKQEYVYVHTFLHNNDLGPILRAFASLLQVHVPGDITSLCGTTWQVCFGHE